MNDHKRHDMTFEVLIQHGNGPLPSFSPLLAQGQRSLQAENARY